MQISKTEVTVILTVIGVVILLSLLELELTQIRRAWFIGAPTQ